jgi:hypothetical protein
MKLWRLAAACWFAATLGNTAEAGDNVTITGVGAGTGANAAALANKALASGVGVGDSMNGGTSKLVRQGNGTFTLGADRATTFTGTITGLDKQGAAPPGLGRDVSPYVNPASVLGGRLAVNSDLSRDVSVGAASVLSGDGRFVDSLTATGTVVPGHALGTVNFTGTYIAGSAYQVDVDATDPSTRLNIGSRVQVLSQPGGNTTRTIVSATGSASTRGSRRKPCGSDCDRIPWGAWISAMGGLDPALSAGAARSAGGVDYRIDRRLVLGLAAGYGTSAPLPSGSTDWSDSVSVAAYGSYTLPNFEANAIAGYGTFNDRLLGHIGFPGLAPRTTDSATQPRDTTALSFRAKTLLTEAAQAYFRYDSELGVEVDNHAVTAGFRVAW